MASYDKETGIAPKVRDALSVMAAGLSGDVAIDILTPDPTPEPTSAEWSYTVQFALVDSSGRVHEWFNGTIDAAVADTSSAGTASIDDTTPAVVNGVGSVVLSGDAETWADTETATVTLDSSELGAINVALADAVFTVTFTE